MGLLHMEGCDHYSGSSQDILSGGWTIETGSPRTSGDGGRQDVGGRIKMDTGDSAQMNLRDRWQDGSGKNQPSGSVHVNRFAIKNPSLPSSANRNWIRFKSNNGSTHCRIRHIGSGQLEVHDKTGIVATSAVGVLNDTGKWQPCEFRINVDNTSGTFELWVGSTKVFDLSGLDTQAASWEDVEQIEYYGLSVDDTSYDDFVWCDGTSGLGATSPMNDKVIGTFGPDEDVTAEIPWLKVGDTTFWECLSGGTPGNDGDSSYVHSPFDSDKWYHCKFEDVPAGTVNIHAIQVRYTQRSDDFPEDSEPEFPYSMVMNHGTRFTGPRILAPLLATPILSTYVDVALRSEVGILGGAWVPSVINATYFGIDGET